MGSVHAHEAPPDPRDLVLDAARETMVREDARADRFDQKARGQMLLAANWFAVVQVVAAVALKAGTPTGWLVAIGLSALAAAGALAVAAKRSQTVWNPKERSELGHKTLRKMREHVNDPTFKDDVVEQYEFHVRDYQRVNDKRATALDKATEAWWWALGFGLVELAIGVTARVLNA